jgi:hypothetical protein
MPAGEKTKKLWSNPDYRKHMSDVHMGYIPTKEQRRKIGLAHKGKKRPPFSKEWKNKMSLNRKGKMMGKNHPKWVEDRTKLKNIRTGI